MLQAVALFLLVMLLLGGFGKLRRWLGRGIGRGIGRRLGGPALGRDQTALQRPRKCRRCGRFLLDAGDCDCGRG